MESTFTDATKLVNVEWTFEFKEVILRQLRARNFKYSQTCLIWAPRYYEQSDSNNSSLVRRTEVCENFRF